MRAIVAMFLGAVLLVDTGTVSASETCQLPVMGGSFEQTCTNVKYSCSEGFPVLSAKCRKKNGDWRNTSLWYYDYCTGDVWNDNGGLRCKRKGLAAAAEYGIDRYGQDLRCFFTNKDFFGCVDACTKEKKCKSFTWVKPGIKGSKALCCLKKGIPPMVPNSCCISGQFP